MTDPPAARFYDLSRLRLLLLSLLTGLALRLLGRLTLRLRKRMADTALQGRKRIAMFEERQIRDIPINVAARLGRVDAIDEKCNRAGAEQEIAGNRFLGFAMVR